MSVLKLSSRGARFTDFHARYVDGRDPFPWTEWLSKAGWRIRSDTTREPRLGVRLDADTAGLRVVFVDPTSVAAAAGIQPGDIITAVDRISTTDPSWQDWRKKFAAQEGAPLSLTIKRDGKVEGAVGVSGLPEADDIVLAKLGAAALTNKV